MYKSGGVLDFRRRCSLVSAWAATFDDNRPIDLSRFIKNWNFIFKIGILEFDGQFSIETR